MCIGYLKKRCWPLALIGIVLVLLFGVLSIFIPLDLTLLSIGIIFILIIVCYLVQIIKLPEIKELLSIPLLGIIIIGLTIAGILLVALYFHPPPQIVTFVEPKKIDATIPAGDLQA
jgi:hypothetical protein